MCTVIDGDSSGNEIRAKSALVRSSACWPSRVHGSVGQQVLQSKSRREEEVEGSRGMRDAARGRTIAPSLAGKLRAPIPLEGT